MGFLAKHIAQDTVQMAGEELTERLRKGVFLINDQHKKIFAFTADLFIHCIGNDDVENAYFGKVIGGAMGLVKTHFKTEEDLMLETKFAFPDYIEHKKEHEDFIAHLTDYVDRFRETGHIDLLMLSSYSRWWVINHIKRFDKNYIAFFNKITENKNIGKMAV